MVKSGSYIFKHHHIMVVLTYNNNVFEFSDNILQISELLKHYNETNELNEPLPLI